MTSRLHITLPNELIDYIIDFLHNDVTALHACSLTSKTFRLSAIHHLFASLTLRATSPSCNKDLHSFVQIASFVRAIRVLWWNATPDYNPLPFLSQPPNSSSHPPLTNLTAVTHDSITYASQGRSTVEFRPLLIGWGGATNLTELHFKQCRFPSLAALTYVLDSCTVLETLTVSTMYLDDFRETEAASHQLRSQCLRMIGLADLSGELRHLIRWLASRPVLPPLDTAILPDCYEADLLIRVILQFSPNCIFTVSSTRLPPPFQ